MKARINTYLNIRTGTPEILPDNNPNNAFFRPGDVVEIVDKVIGERYKEVNVWYRLFEGSFIWSGAVGSLPEEQELISLKKQRFDAIIENTWQRTKGEGCTIAVIDTGIQKTHPFLESQVDENGSFSFLQNNTNDAFFCDNSHGTIMAGLICGNNKGNFIGYAPMARVRSLKVTNSDQDFIDTLISKLNDALDYLLSNNRADIINLSLQFDPDKIEQDLQTQTSSKIQQLIDKGCIVLTASGNDGFLAFPGNITSVITVGVLKDGYDLKSFSNGVKRPSSTGKEIDFFLETYNNNIIVPGFPDPFPSSNLESSEATAIFSGIVALKKSLKRDYNQSQLKADLLSAKKLSTILPNLKVYKIDINQFLSSKI